MAVGVRARVRVRVVVLVPAASLSACVCVRCRAPRRWTAGLVWRAWLAALESVRALEHASSRISALIREVLVCCPFDLSGVLVLQQEKWLQVVTRKSLRIMYM